MLTADVAEGAMIRVRGKASSSFLAVTVFAVLWSVPAPLVPGRSCSEAENSAIEQVVQEYAAAWEANNKARVLAVFTDDAVLIPHHGVKPVEGRSAIERFWWPSDGPPTRVELLRITTAETQSEGNFAFSRGRSEVRYSIEERGQWRTYSNEGNSLMILRKQRDGRWLISRHIWNDPVTRPVNPQPASDRRNST